MNPELTKLIEQYLSGELSSSDAQAFEDRMAKNETLRDAVKQQREVHDGAKRAYQRQQIQKIGKRYHFRKNLLKGGLSILIVGAIAAASLFVYNQFNSEDEIPVLTEEVKAKLDKQAPIDLDAQYFVIPEDGGVVLSEDGVLISVPKGAFMHNGKPYNDPVAVQFQEAIDGSDIMQSGLSTTSNGEMLETGGMISVTGYTIDGEPLDFNPKVGVYVQMPIQDNRTDMQLYDGEVQADGSINWVDPKPLEKIPVPVAMSELDFYPSGYENYLDKQKWKTSKASRDSLYLSFEEDGCDDRMLQAKQIWDKTCSSCHHPTKEGTGPALAGVRSLYWEKGVGDEGLISWVRNWQDAAESNSFLASRTTLTGSAMPVYGQSFTDDQILSIFEYVDVLASKDIIIKEPKVQPITDMGIDSKERKLFHFADSKSLNTFKAIPIQEDWEEFSETDSTDIWEGVDQVMVAPGYIYPSNVLAFWNKGFNNTNLATRDFERRMRVIHETCSNAVLEVYTSNIDKSLKECDDQLVAMGYSQFEKFAAENVGKLKAGNPHVKHLKQFYEKSIKQLKNRNSKLQEAESHRRSEHDVKTRKSRNEEAKRTSNRESQAYIEEFQHNLKSVYKQLGYTRGFTITSASRSFPPGGARSAVKNIDRLVAEATANRTSLSVKKNGKTAKITYNEFTFEVSNPKKYIKLFAYVLPYELNSYQRIEGKNGKFSHPLNNDFRYNIAVVGVKENGYELFKKLNIKSGNLGKIKLQTVSKKKLDADVKQLNSNRGITPMRIDSELEWLAQERKDYKEQKMRKEMTVFRDEIRNIIFPCCNKEQVQFQGQGQAQQQSEGEEGEFGLD